VAPLKNPMHLAFDFLQGQKVILDLVHSTFSEEGETTRTVQKELADTVNYEIKDYGHSCLMICECHRIYQRVIFVTKFLSGCSC
jgi:hypothetical protein